MQDQSTLIQCEHVSARSFDEVVAAFRAAVGAGDGERLRKAVDTSTGPGDFERAGELADSGLRIRSHSAT